MPGQMHLKGITLTKVKKSKARGLLTNRMKDATERGISLRLENPGRVGHFLRWAELSLRVSSPARWKPALLALLQRRASGTVD